MSVGKYNNVFYFRGTTHTSTVWGGLLTIGVIGLLIGYAIFILNSTIKLQNYNLE